MSVDMVINIRFVLFVRQPVRHSRGKQHRLRLREHRRDLGVPPAAQGPARAGRDRSSSRRTGCRSLSSSSSPTSSSRSSVSAGSDRRTAPSTAARRTRSSASASWSAPCCSSCSGGSCRTGSRPHWREETPTMPDATRPTSSRRRCARPERSSSNCVKGRPLAAPSSSTIGAWSRSPAPRSSTCRAARRPIAGAPDGIGVTVRRRPEPRADADRESGHGTRIRRSSSGARSGCSRPA